MTLKERFSRFLSSSLLETEFMPVHSMFNGSELNSMSAE
jgi:hypothetical protein